jgi:D-alanine-D-alanine ligase-like ATP-grasp enzyme
MITVKTTQKEDSYSLAKIRQITRTLAYTPLDEKLKREDFNLSENLLIEKSKLFSDLIASKNEFWFTAFEDNKIIGFIRANILETTGWIKFLFVLPEYHSQGVGTLLMQKALAKLSAAREIKISVIEKNKAAISFYKKFGFEVLPEKTKGFVSNSGVKLSTVHMHKQNHKLLPSARLLYKEFVLNENCKIEKIYDEQNAFIVNINNNLIFIKAIHTPLNTQSAMLLADNKVLTKELLKFEGINTPDFIFYLKKEGKVFENLTPAIESLIKKYTKIIAKPINGLKSQDVFLNITSINEAKNAWEVILSKDYSGIIFEKFIEGDVYRLLILNGKLIAALRREKGHIMGDGVHTIQELISERNERLNLGYRAVGRIRISEILLERLKNQGYELNSIPESSQKVFTEIDFSNLETVTEVTDLVNSKLAETLGLFASRIGLNLTGVDIISKDISQVQDSYVIEINKEPSLDFHHYPDYGKPINVAKKITEAIIIKYKAK